MVGSGVLRRTLCIAAVKTRPGASARPFVDATGVIQHMSCPSTTQESKVSDTLLEPPASCPYIRGLSPLGHRQIEAKRGVNGNVTGGRPSWRLGHHLECSA
jgi:hypothetical protein